ncbi:MAG: nucleotidyltransferase family protein [Lachnospiraceae bacterium]|nr:nucleotidyltransferase family protein [Lachnospiraceae bacterium]
MDTGGMDRYMILQDAVIVEAMQKIDDNAKGILFVVDESEHLVGVITDGDIRRWLIRTGNLRGCVREIMNRNPKALPDKDKESALEFMDQYTITAVPIITNDNRVVEIIFQKGQELNNKSGRSAISEVPVVIMAGGKGTRLYPYTKILPKPLIPIGDIPIMERIMRAFMEYDVKDFYATVNYKKEMIKSYFSDEHIGCRLHYIDEDKPLGTAGSIRLMNKRFERPFILTNCDILIRADYSDIYRYHMESDNELTIVTALKNVVIPYGVIYSGENGRIDAMEEKPHLSYLVNTGMYILNEYLMDEIPENTVFHMTDLTDKLLREGRNVGMYPISEDSFLDMGEMEEMHRMEQKLNLNSD